MEINFPFFFQSTRENEVEITFLVSTSNQCDFALRQQDVRAAVNEE